MGRGGRKTVTRLHPSPLPDAIFGRPRAEYSVPVLRRILNIFFQKLQKNETRANLLTKLSVLENAQTKDIRETVSQLLRRGEKITRAAIAAGVQPEDEDEEDEEEEQSEQPDRNCEICIQTLSASAFAQDKITPGCNHDSSVCRSCLTLHIQMHLDNEWEPVKCLSCSIELPFNTVELYTTPDEFQRYASSIYTSNITSDRTHTAPSSDCCRSIC